jgi:hypothetical protein
VPDDLSQDSGCATLELKQEEFMVNFRAFLVSVGAAAALCLSAPAWAGFTLSLSASPTFGVVGSQATVDVNLALDAGENVNAIGLSLNYDPAVLQFHSGLGGSLLDPIDWFLVDIFDTGSSVNYLALALFGLDGPVASGSITQLTFDLIGAGAAELTLSDVILEGFNPFFGPYVVAATALPTGVTIDVTSPANDIPAPASLLLVGLGLALLGWTRRNAAPRNASWWRTTVSSIASGASLATGPSQADRPRVEFMPGRCDCRKASCALPSYTG